MLQPNYFKEEFEMADVKNYYSGSNNGADNENRGSQLVYNLIGAQPTAVEFIVEKRTAEKILKDIASDMLNDGNPQNDILSARFVILPSSDYVFDDKGKRTNLKPRVSAQVVIPARNTNIVSNEGNDFIRPEDTVRYSEKFKQFVNTYCNDDNKSAYLTKPTREGGVSYRAIVIDIAKFFGRIFDYNGFAFKEANGKNTPVDYVNLETECIFEYNNSKKATDIIAFRVKKSFQNSNPAKNLVFDVFDTRKGRRNYDDDDARDNGRRDDKDFRKDYRR